MVNNDEENEKLFIQSMSKRLLRTFLSIPVPDEITALQDKLKSTIIEKKVRISWIKKGNIHLTLKFIGDTPEDEISQITSVIQPIIENTCIMEFQITGTGCFPKKERPRILWLGIDGDLSPLQELVTKINEALDPLGYPKVEKDFIPHLTLARIKYPQKVTPDISEFLKYDYDPIKFMSNKIHLMSSELFHKGSVYTILGTHFLR